MGTELTNRLYNLTKAQSALEEKWNKFVLSQEKTSKQVKEIAKLLKQVKSEKDRKKREALRFKMQKAMQVYHTLGTTRYHAWKDFFLITPPLEKAISELRKHITHREKYSLFRTKQHTIDAKKTLQTAIDRAEYFNKYAEQNWKDIEFYQNKFRGIW